MSGTQPTENDVLNAAAWIAQQRRLEKPLSPRRAREFKGRYLRKVFGTRKQRAERFANLTRLYGYDTAVTNGCSCPECAPQY